MLRSPHRLERIAILLMLVLLAPHLPRVQATRAAETGVPGGAHPTLLQKGDMGVGLRLDATQTYTITDLGPFTPLAINNSRQVVGGGQCSFLWVDGNLSCLADPGGQVLIARDINEEGQVLLAGSNLLPHVLWTDTNQNAQIDADEKQALPALPGYERAFPTALNDSGRVIGYSFTVFDDESSIGSAVAWTNGVPSGLGKFTPYDINNAGIIVGPLADQPKGVRWVNGVLNPLPADFIPVAINERGELVGFASAEFTLRQHLWLPAAAYGLPAGLHDLGFTWFVGSGSAADINEHGQVVGGGRYLWQNGELTDVHTLLPPDSGWSALTVEAINDNGDLVGTGTLNGQRRGFMLSPPLRWTLMYYLAADNNLSDSYPPIFQHLESMANLPGVRILVLWDTGGNNGSWYYEVQYDTDPSKFATYTEGVDILPQGEVNMGASPTLSDFIQWSVARSPSEHYALILDDHGSGLGGLAWDDTSNRDFLTLPELKLALDTAFDGTGQKMDVLYMAMCLMGMLEDAYQVRERADYYVASEDLQTTYTSYLTGFDPLMSPAQAAAAFADAYAQEMIARNKAYTIAAADLSRLDTLVTATNGLGQALAARMAVITPTLTTVAGLVQRFDNVSPRGLTLVDTYVDLYDFADNVQVTLVSEAAIVAQAAAVKEAVDDYVIYEAHASSATKNLDNSYGVSIFFPAGSSSFYNPTNYTFATGANWNAATTAAAPLQATTWAGFLARYVQATAPDAPDSPTPPEPLPKLDDTLAPEPDDFSLYLPLVNRN